MVQIRTDMAAECRELAGSGKLEGVAEQSENIGGMEILTIKILNSEGERAVGKPEGTYITVNMDNFYPDDDKIEAVAKKLGSLLPEGSALVAGLGNMEITPDSIGPRAAARVLATRHILGTAAKNMGLDDLRTVSVIVPGVLGQTGMETAEILKSAAEAAKPDFIIAIDALASRHTSRLGSALQMSDSGISPGSGVGNRRAELSKKTLGVPVISLGVPTVVDAPVLAYDKALEAGISPEKAEEIWRKTEKNTVVTPREIDLLTQKSSYLLAMAINCALHPCYTPADFRILVD